MKIHFMYDTSINDIVLCKSPFSLPSYMRMRRNVKLTKNIYPQPNEYWVNIIRVFYICEGYKEKGIYFGCFDAHTRQLIMYS